MRQDRWLGLLKGFGQWRCEQGRAKGKGTVKCAGGPIHSCRFEFRPKIRTYTHQLERRPVIKTFW